MSIKDNIKTKIEVTKNGIRVMRQFSHERQAWVYYMCKPGDPSAVEITEMEYDRFVRNVNTRYSAAPGLFTPVAASPASKETSDGSSADYYKLPPKSKQLQDLIAHKNMNAQIGEIFRACYRYGQVEHSPEIRDLKKMRFYIDAELARLEGKSIEIPD